MAADFLRHTRIGLDPGNFTTNLRLAAIPGNVSLPSDVSGLAYDSVVDVTQMATVDKEDLIERVGSLPGPLSDEVDSGLRLVLSR